MNRLARTPVFLGALTCMVIVGCGSRPTADVSHAPASTNGHQVSGNIDGETRGSDDSTSHSAAAQVAEDGPGKDTANPNVASKIAPPIIGQLKGRQHTIIIHTASDGPRFTITTPDGRVVATALSVDEIRAQHPSIFKAYEQTFAQGGAYLDASLGPEAPSAR